MWRGVEEVVWQRQVNCLMDPSCFQHNCETLLHDMPLMDDSLHVFCPFLGDSSWHNATQGKGLSQVSLDLIKAVVFCCCAQRKPGQKPEQNLKIEPTFSLSPSCPETLCTNLHKMMHVVLQALLGCTATYLLVVFGASFVFFVRKPSPVLLDRVMAIAIGLMLVRRPTHFHPSRCVDQLPPSCFSVMVLFSFKQEVCSRNQRQRWNRLFFSQSIRVSDMTKQLRSNEHRVSLCPLFVVCCSPHTLRLVLYMFMNSAVISCKKPTTYTFHSLTFISERFPSLLSLQQYANPAYRQGALSTSAFRTWPFSQHSAPCRKHVCSGLTNKNTASVLCLSYPFHCSNMSSC